MALTDEEFERANKRAQARKAKYPSARSAHYDKERGKVVVVLANEGEAGEVAIRARAARFGVGAQLGPAAIWRRGFGLAAVVAAAPLLVLAPLAALAAALGL